MANSDAREMIRVLTRSKPTRLIRSKSTGQSESERFLMTRVRYEIPAS